MKVFVSLYCIKEIGGISTSAYNLLHEIACRYDVTLCVLTNYVGSAFYLPENIKLIEGSSKLGMATISRSLQDKQNVFQKLLRNYFRFVRRIQKEKFIYKCLKSIKAKGQYDVALAFTDFKFPTNQGFDYYDYYFVLNHVNAKRKIAWIHNNPSYLGYKHDDSIKRFERFDGIVNVSYDCKKILDNIVPEYSNKSFVVYNMYNIDEIRQKSKEFEITQKDKKIRFVTVARVSNKQKRIVRIVNVCRRLINEGYRDFEWIIVGEGEDRHVLQSTVFNEHMDSVIQFVGLQPNPYPFMLNADAFVLTSLYEGLPMTVKEAQILGCPTLITSFGAASEAVDENRSGEICDNSEGGVYNMIKAILDSPEKLKTYKTYLNKNPISNNLALEQLDWVLKGN